MSSEAARNLSIPELLCALNEKLGLESSRLRQMCLPPIISIASLKAEVSSPLIYPPQRVWWKDLLTLNPSDRKPRNKSTRRSEPRTFFTERIAASEQVTPGDHL